MQRSTDRIYTTHVGSLARPPALLELMKAAAQGDSVDPAELTEAERLAVTDVVAWQRAAGLDLITDGEQTKPGLLHRARAAQTRSGPAARGGRRDRGSGRGVRLRGGAQRRGRQRVLSHPGRVPGRRRRRDARGVRGDHRRRLHAADRRPFPHRHVQLRPRRGEAGQRARLRRRDQPRPARHPARSRPGCTPVTGSTRVPGYTTRHWRS